MENKPNAKHNQSVTKALSIINLLAAAEGYLSLKEISERLDLTPSTAHHIITSLKLEKFVEQDPESRKYRLGIRCYEISLSDNYYKILAEKAKPALESLARESGESANLAILVNGQITYIGQEQSSKSQIMKTFVNLGQRSPVHCTGVGKVLISELPENEIKRTINTHGLKKFTSYTITSADDLLEELELVKKQNYATDREEREEGVFCVAVPLKNSTGKTIASISLSGPIHRMLKITLESIVESLTNHASEISKNL